MKTKNYLIALVCACLFPFVAQGQVKVGEKAEPVKGAVLDMTTTTAGYRGGLLLPHVYINQLTRIPASFTDADKMPGYNSVFGVETNTDLTGLIVYNTNTTLSPAGKGVYLWDGENWILIVSTN